MCEKYSSQYEIKMAIDEIGIKKNGGSDKVPSELLKFICNLCPTLIMKVSQNISDLITSKAKNHLRRYVIFIHKTNRNK